MNDHSISAVIPNYNGRQLLAENLPFLIAALTASGCTYEIIITDDASTDDSVEFILKHYPHVILVQHAANTGFSKNINRGIAAAKMQLVLLLNSDIKLNEDYFLNQLRYFDRPDTFGVMGLVLDERTGAVSESCKYPLPSVFKINHFKNITPDSSSGKVYTYYLCGANALVDRAKLNELGGFNELYSPFYQEDLDLSLRAWENGWKCYYEGSAICRHAVSSTIKAHSTRQYIKLISTRNKFILHYFHLSGFKLFLWEVTTLLSLSFRWLFAKFYYYKAARLFLTMLPQVRRSKNEFISAAKQKQRYICFADVKQHIKRSLDQQLTNSHEYRS